MSLTERWQAKRISILFGWAILPGITVALMWRAFHGLGGISRDEPRHGPAGRGRADFQQKGDWQESGGAGESLRAFR